MPSYFICAHAERIFPDVDSEALSSMIPQRRRSRRVLDQVWGDDSGFRREVVEAMYSQSEVREHLEEEALQLTRLNRLRRVVFVELHDFLSSFERSSASFSLALEGTKTTQMQIGDAVRLFVESGACPPGHVEEVAVAMERAMRLLHWRPGFSLEVSHPRKRMRSNYQIRHRVTWGEEGSPSECLEQHRDCLGGGSLGELLHKVSGQVADAMLAEAHTPAPEEAPEAPEEGETTCALCLEEVVDDEEEVTRLGCGHRFHTACLRKQLSHAITGHQPLRCGLCRGSIVARGKRKAPPG